MLRPGTATSITAIRGCGGSVVCFDYPQPSMFSRAVFCYDGAMPELNSLIKKINSQRNAMAKMYTKKQVYEYVEQAYVVSLHYAMVQTGQRLHDVSWLDLDPDYRAAIHKEAKNLARSLVK
jgi:hypothetical protein